MKKVELRDSEQAVKDASNIKEVFVIIVEEYYYRGLYLTRVVS
jgi:hypothetical protein